MKRLLLSIVLPIVCLSSFAQILQENINFETPDSLFQIDTSLVGNIWQIGRPSKILFDSAYSATNAVVTDTINYYPTNNLSTFTIKVYYPTFSIAYPTTFIQFRHKYDTDTLHDGGYIEVSYDSLTTWTNISNDPNFLGFYYDQVNQSNPIISNGNAAFTGRSNSWQYEFFNWCYWLAWPDTTPVYLRFVFSSDSIQNNREGWMIDDIQVWTDWCEGIPELQNNNLISLFPNPTSDELRINHTNSISTSSIQVINYSGEVVYIINNFTGETINVRQLPNGIYLLKYSDGKGYEVKKFVVQH